MTAPGAWSGRRAVVAVAAVVAAGLWIYQPPGNLLYMAAEPVLALAALAILVVFGERLPGALGLWVPIGIVVGAIGWSVIDARLLLAITLVIAVRDGQVAIRFYARSGGPRFPWYLWPWFTPAVLGVALAVVAIWRVRRQAVL